MNTPLLKNRLFTRFNLIVSLMILTSSSQAALKVGDAFPDLTAHQLEGKLPDSFKGKIVLVDFWASWCAPCAMSFPVLESLHHRYKDRLVIIAVSVDEKPAKMEAFLKKHSISFVVVRDAAHTLAGAVDADTMPTSFLLDAEGQIRFRHSGFHGEESQKQYLEEIESLLKGTP